MWSASSSTVISMRSSSTWPWPMSPPVDRGRPPRCRPRSAGCDLWALADATEDGERAQAQRAGEGTDGLVDLADQLDRVGARMRARGRPDPRSRRSAARRVSMGNTKARVLPEPVRPRPSTSRPARESGSVAVWMGNGRVMPLLDSTVHSSAGTPRSAKVTSPPWGDRTGSVGRGWGRGRGGATRRHWLTSLSEVRLADQASPP